MRKIIGNTVGMGLPKPNLMQNDPTKGDYVKGKEEFLAQAEINKTQTERLVVVPIKYDTAHNDGGGWVDDDTFAYTEGVGGNYGPIVAKESKTAGGVLRVNWDTNTARHMGCNLYLFDASGAAYKTAGCVTAGVQDAFAGDNYSPKWGDPGSQLSWGHADAPFSVAIPDGCTCMCAMRWVPGSGVSDNGAIADATAFQNWVLAGGITFTVEKAFSGYVEKDQGQENKNRYLVTDENGVVIVGGIVGATDDSSDIPDYITAEIDAVTARLTAVQEAHPKSATFAFKTDGHRHYNTMEILRHNLHAVQKIRKENRVEFLALGGDNLAESGQPHDYALAMLKHFGGILRESDVRTAAVKGNHDDNTLSGYTAVGKYPVSYVLRDGEFYHALHRHNENVFNIHMDENRDRLYYYVDLPSQQIRVIFLNVIDIPIRDDGTGELVYKGCRDRAFSDEQLNWVAHDALDFSDKKHPEQWGVITVQHITDCPDIPEFSDTPVTQDRGGAAMCGIFRAFNARTAFSSTVATGDFAHNVSCDFSNAQAELICRISGHTHADRHVINDGILYVSTISAGTNGVGTGVASDGNTYNKVPESGKESAFDLFTVDKDSRTIYATRYGAGVDRVIQWPARTENLFDIGTAAADYHRHGNDNTAPPVVVDALAGTLTMNSESGNESTIFRKTVYPVGGGNYRIQSTAENAVDLPQPNRIYLRVFDADGNLITSGMSGWSYVEYFKAFLKKNDGTAPVTAVEFAFTLPANAATFKVGFGFSTPTGGASGTAVTIRDIELTEGIV